MPFIFDCTVYDVCMLIVVDLLGNKGALLCEMFRLGIPVPPGFVLSTHTCLEFLKQNQHLSSEMIDEYAKAVHELERMTNKTFTIFDKTEKKNKQVSPPLLLSVRSGAVVSMPGMMSTVLNVGMNDQVVEQMIELSNNRKWALDTYRRFLQMFGEVVLGVHSQKYDDVLEKVKNDNNVQHDFELSEANMLEVVDQFKRMANVPDDPWIQLQMSIEAVFKSWNSPRAKKYREFNDIPNDLGTAVIVQTMVFGNLNDNSGSGVCFTRSPSTGEKFLYGEYLPNAQGEDVVSGVRTPLKLLELEDHLPEIYRMLHHHASKLELHFKDIQVSISLFIY